MTNERKKIRRFVQGLNVEIQEGLAALLLVGHLLKLWRKHRELRAQGCKLGTFTLRKGIFLVILLVRLVRVPRLLRWEGEREE